MEPSPYNHIRPLPNRIALSMTSSCIFNFDSYFFLQIVCRRFHVNGWRSYFDRISLYYGFAADINAEMNGIRNPTTSTGLAVRFEEWPMDKKSPDIDDIDFEDSPDVYADII